MCWESCNLHPGQEQEREEEREGEVSNGDTPRTDAEEYTNHMGERQGVVDAALCRQLERELAECKAALASAIFDTLEEAALICVRQNDIGAHGCALAIRCIARELRDHRAAKVKP